ncbi:hemerythrin domain-containing protein [Methylobacterium gregans]|uniref:Hemerythrin-like domain-containing protein n=1 Tax=Methylobacterium gregans TaxID=374424 RepID=A0AA37HUV0_9HYPH|nr:hemerythrin domain-containing protein [Methylobacterium gregans]MDQ0520518.1 hypothetical protein [Methylobacterium gregans]GJD82026.1 hypothetical protein NBEOAGPD_5285 [Methylobacterium gregans]GLS52223.1 hypothetical protein GCM10007886_04050 [Methylobacterium gregans]
MDVWQLIERDHENINQLIREIPYAMNGPGVIRSRERMLGDLMDALELHAIGLDASLYEPLSRESGTNTLIEELHRAHAEFMRQLKGLVRYRQKGSDGWLNAFEDVTFLVDQHLHQHVHELIPMARKRFSHEEAHRATQAFIRAKTIALRRRRSTTAGGIMSSEAALITTVTAVVAGLGYLAWRNGLFAASKQPHRSATPARPATAGYGVRHR